MVILVMFAYDLIKSDQFTFISKEIGEDPKQSVKIV